MEWGVPQLIVGRAPEARFGRIYTGLLGDTLRQVIILKSWLIEPRDEESFAEISKFNRISSLEFNNEHVGPGPCSHCCNRDQDESGSDPHPDTKKRQTRGARAQGVLGS